MQTSDSSLPIRLLLIGFGRMGLTHLSILSGLVVSRPLEVFIVDNSVVSRRIAKEVLPTARVFRKLSDISANHSQDFFDFCLITTPPIDRKPLVEEASRLSKSVFIEKPLTVVLGRNQMSGYVLQHSPLNAEVNECMSEKLVTHIVGRLTTNLSFAAVEKGWRSGKFGSVLFEFGGHLLTLIAAVCGTPGFLMKPVQKSELVVEACEEDRVIFRFCSSGIEVSMHLIAGSPEVRKASYEIELSTEDEVFTYDLYTLKRRQLADEADQETLVNIAATSTSVPFYVRGFEFTAQMEAFLNHTFDRLDVEQIENIEKLVEGIS